MNSICIYVYQTNTNDFNHMTHTHTVQLNKIINIVNEDKSLQHTLNHIEITHRADFPWPAADVRARDTFCLQRRDAPDTGAPSLHAFVLLAAPGDGYIVPLQKATNDFPVEAGSRSCYVTYCFNFELKKISMYMYTYIYIYVPPTGRPFWKSPLIVLEILLTDFGADYGCIYNHKRRWRWRGIIY